MRLLPYETYTITTQLTTAQIIERLEREVAIIKVFGFESGWKRGNKMFVGKIAADSFKINRVINYKNSFNPVIEGNIVENLRGTHINIKLRLNYGVLVFMMLWCGFNVCWIFLVVSRTNTIEVLPAAVGFLAFGLVLPCVGFNIGLNKTKNMLSSIFQ